MSDLRELYQEVIFDHNRHPRNFGKLINANHHAEGFNPLCGDSLDLYLIIDNDRITDIKFEGQGCAISTASASLMTEVLKGKTLTEAEQLFEGFHQMVTTGQQPSFDIGKLSVLAGVSEFPARVKCASLSWHTLHAALNNSNQPVTTE
ncbi:SUF system NifU family Fe-S cluster assembly protein [Ferrovum sp. PN-J185]|uniref:Fe-S cluster assembly sulfur transfer protein SufU n=1 Tax=Ferrovum sp. PN-J185 TaxID=1356306 RepID=UPI0007941555|nr:SUF system NifU family Fe-S cluster assembly protein [Ferrovum sp. PN-J185]KXW55962.1 zinc-dependent sulfurtransferase SufU [Ferrovum sp. PN-J185]MCC6068326.1 SUF system NifU family Fe-S cluster assembly protein [Ferrovum sp. PN-J185]MDE1891947.1 SUF system NifU family Fe-S cluster assembly protein [Betaproteobacteria bacterium]MDE2056941.1 SUF system NifU family Fe-S cluster assembly protein [Betaproteobacteria bacterium]